MKKTAPLLKEAEVKIEEGFARNSFFWIIIVVILLSLAIFSSLYFYNQYQKSQKLLGSKNVTTDLQSKEVITAVGKLFELPTNEQPTIATVSDKAKLVNQPFFAKAQNGDKVLIYSLNKQAILYRPSLNKIISIGTLNLAPSLSPQPVSSAQVQQVPVITPTPSSIAKPTPTPISVQ